jgi:hypothetical protein
VAAALALAAVAAACGGDDDAPGEGSGGSSSSVPAALESAPPSESGGGTESTSAPSTSSESTDSGSTDSGSTDVAPTDTGSTDTGSAGGASTDGESTDSGSTDTGSMDTAPGTAVVEVAGDRFEFVVIQCVRDQPSPLTGDVIEFQLDGVPVATPDELVERLLGVIEADADVLAEIEPVVEFGPILSVTRLAAGGDLVAVTDLATIEAVSDPDPTTTRFAEIGDESTGTTVSASTTADGRPMTVAAVCP